MPIPSEHFDYTVREWSAQPFNQITERLSDISVFFDIGANVGGFTEIIHRMFPKAKAYCFEPMIFNYELLLKNVPFATSVNKGIYYGYSKAKALWRGSNEGAIFLEYVNAGKDVVDTGHVMELSPLEDFDFPKPDLIKLDVEGAEENILEFSSLIRKTPYVIVEWHPDHVNPVTFFKKHLPHHEILVNIQNIQFLLCLR